MAVLRLRSSSCPDDTWDLFGFPGVYRTEGGYEISAAVFAMKPRSRGSVRLNRPNPRTPLAVDHGFLADERDAQVLAEGFERLRELVDDAAARPYAGAERLARSIE